MCTFQNKNLYCKIYFFNLKTLSLSLSLSPPIFGQLHCHNSFFFPPIFCPNQFLSPLFSNFGNLYVIILFFFPPFSVTSFPKFLLNFFSLLPYNFGNLVATFFFSSNFQQLGCHNSFFLSPLPYNSDNLVATITFLLLSFGHFIWAVELGCRNFGNHITKIQIFFSLQPSHHFSLFSHTFC